MTQTCTLVISTLPPKQCGIASYAQQLISEISSNGIRVRTIALDADGPEPADIKLRLSTPIKWARVFAKASSFKLDTIYLNYSHDFFLARSYGNNLFLFSMLMLFLSYRSEDFSVVVHEFDDHMGKTWQQRLLDFTLVRRATRLLFHTDHEKQGFLDIHGKTFEAKSQLVNHGANFAKRYHKTHATARNELGLAPESIVFLCAGFFQRHKGFDIAIEQFAHAGSHARLKIVGSRRTRHEDVDAYRHLLHGKAHSVSPNIEILEDYVSDKTFDQWLVACNFLVLPYRSIWSSGVAARAMLFSKPIIARRLPSLEDQLADADVIWFDTDEELGEHFRTLSSK